MLGKYIGERLSKEEYTHKYPDGKSYYVLSMPGEEGVYVDASDVSVSNWTRYINHDDVSTNVKWVEGGNVVAIKPIPAHSELYLNYGKQYWKGWNHIAASTGDVAMIVGGVDLDDEGVRDGMVDSVITMLQTEPYSNMFYNVPGDDLPIHYILDEFGTRIRRSNNGRDVSLEESNISGNVRMEMFHYLFSGLMFNLVFPTEDIMEEEEVIIKTN